ncbi:uncharacterized protein LOC129317430 [Prosopis cineraria]|uniref:uncharacterized protein LOC129317430 n=1 Tax=Prosopis cineraria TaxID=364024 RepID=UPI0024104C0B|nr:uncharacterized protein LOC129317430 [Prosopis cineraria]
MAAKREVDGEVQRSRSTVKRKENFIRSLYHFHRFGRSNKRSRRKNLMTVRWRCDGKKEHRPTQQQNTQSNNQHQTRTAIEKHTQRNSQPSNTHSNSKTHTEEQPAIKHAQQQQNAHRGTANLETRIATAKEKRLQDPCLNYCRNKEEKVLGMLTGRRKEDSATPNRGRAGRRVRKKEREEEEERRGMSAAQKERETHAQVTDVPSVLYHGGDELMTEKRKKKDGSNAYSCYTYRGGRAEDLRAP